MASVEPGTLTERWRTVLINTKATDEWDYPGVLNVMKDGSLIVIYGYHIARLNPTTGEIEASNVLPTGESAPRDTAYNGYDALPDGTIIAKTVNRQKGCSEQGFSAFLNCPNPSDVPPSVMVAINPMTLKVISQITLPEPIGGRLTTARYNKDYIYLPGTKSLYRYTFQNGKLAADPTWGPVPYLKNGQTAGSALAVSADRWSRLTNGGAPTSTPMSVVAVSRPTHTSRATSNRFASSGQEQLHPIDGLRRPRVTLDLRDGRGRGKIGAVALNNGKLSTVWTADQTTLSFTTLIGPQNQRVLIGTNIPVKFFKQLKSYTTEQVIWRDAATGKQLASSDQFPKMSAGILVTPGYAGLQYFLTASGHIIELQVTPNTGG